METIPENWGKDDLSGFLELARRNRLASFANEKSKFEALKDIDNIFRKTIEISNNSEMYFPALFLLLSHSSYLASVELALSGQITPTYMTIRGCLENALYGFHFSKNADNAVTWLERHKSEFSLKKVKDTFKPSAMLTELQSHDQEIANIAKHLYDSSIDYGAHPNQRGLLTNLGLIEEDSSIKFELKYLNPATVAWEACLKAVAEVGICSLLIFKLVFPERFTICNIPDAIDQIKNKYSNVFVEIKYSDSLNRRNYENV